MTLSPICSAEVETRAHVLAPLPSEECSQDGAASRDPATRDAASENPLRHEAYQKGAEDARRQAEQETLHAAEAFAKAAEQLRSLERGFAEQIQRDILRLSLAIARQVVMAEMKTNPDALGEVIARLLDDAEDRKVIAVRLHPEDAGRFNRSAAAQALGKAGITVQPSPDVGPGGVVLETGFGKLDARIETRLDEIAAALLGDAPVPPTGPGEGLELPADLSPAAPALRSSTASAERSGRHKPRRATEENEFGESLWETQPAYSEPAAPERSVTETPDELFSTRPSSGAAKSGEEART